jgi:4-amino-4-deoxy-L-arabinose transferase-like glycosyltransferase
MNQKPEHTFTIKLFINVVLIGLLAILVVSIIILSGIPPVSRDALTHHLAIPKLYLKNGGFYEIPSLEFSYYPMNLDLLYMIPLYFGNDITPKFIHFAFALLTAWLIFRYLKKRTDTTYALAGVLCFLSLPVIIKLSITAYVDLGLIFFSTASLMCLFQWIENDFEIKYLLISAVLSGLALGTKYNGLIVLILFALFIPFIYSKKKSSGAGKPGAHPIISALPLKTVGYGMVFILTAMVVFSPWTIRNYIWTKNPVYPLFQQWFQNKGTVPGSDLITESSAESEQTAPVFKGPLPPFLTRKIIYNETWWQTLLIPIRIFFQGQDDNPKYFDGRLNPYLLLLPIFAFFPKKREDYGLRTEKKVLLAFAILFLLFAFLQVDMRIRYVSPMIPPLIILSILGLHDVICTIGIRFSKPTKKLIKGLVVLGISLLLCMNAGYIWNLFQRLDPLSYLSGRVGRHEYIENHLPEYPAIKFANENLPEDAKILALFLGNRGYYSDRDILFGVNLFYAIAAKANSADALLFYLKQEKMSHLIVRYDLFKKHLHSRLEKKQKQIVADFLDKHTRLLFSKRGCGLYRLGKDI